MTKEKMVSFNETVYVGLAPNYDRSVKVIPLTRLKIFSQKVENFRIFLIEILVKMGSINNRTKVRHSPGTELLQVERNEGPSEITETQSIL